jgi:hypothetical protein
MLLGYSISLFKKTYFYFGTLKPAQQKILSFLTKEKVQVQQKKLQIKYRFKTNK